MLDYMLCLIEYPVVFTMQWDIVTIGDRIHANERDVLLVIY